MKNSQKVKIRFKGTLPGTVTTEAAESALCERLDAIPINVFDAALAEYKADLVRLGGYYHSMTNDKMLWPQYVMGAACDVNSELRSQWEFPRYITLEDTYFEVEPA